MKKSLTSYKWGNFFLIEFKWKSTIFFLSFLWTMTIIEIHYPIHCRCCLKIQNQRKELPLHFSNRVQIAMKSFIIYFNSIWKRFSSFVSFDLRNIEQRRRRRGKHNERKNGKNESNSNILRNDTNEEKEKRIMETFPFGSNDINFQFTLIYTRNVC